MGTSGGSRLGRRSARQGGSGPSPLQGASWIVDARAYAGSGDLLDLSGNALNAVLGAGAAAPLFLPFGGEKYVYLPPVSGNTITTPHTAAMPTTEFDVRMRLRPGAWVPGAPSRRMFMKGNSGVNQWNGYINADGTMSIGYSTDGSAFTFVGSTIDLGSVFAAGTGGWVRWTFRQNNGGGSYEAKFWWAPDAPAPPAAWTQLGATRTGAAVTMATGTNPVTIGTGGGETYDGRLYAIEIASVIDGPAVASFNAADIISPYQSVIGGGGETWTLNRPTSGRKLAVVDRPLFLLGTDDYFEVADNALLDFAAGQDVTALFAFRSPSSASTQMVLAKDGLAGASSWDLQVVNNNTVTARFGATAASASGTINGSAHVAAVRRSSDNWQTALDGVLGSAVTGAAAVSLANTSVLSIGRRSSGNYFEGEFLGAAIFRRALSDAEIAAVVREFA